MKILVTGGCGFIGSCLVRKLMFDTHFCEVVNVDAMTYAATTESLGSIVDDPRYAFYDADISDGLVISEILDKEKPDVIFHLAAESHVDRSINGSAAFIDTNIFGTYMLIEETRKHLIAHPNKDFRFVHVSTDEVYGSLEFGDFTMFHEDHPYRPNSPYSASKAASDHLVRAWVHTYQFPAMITHCSNNYGPYQQPEKLIPKAIINFFEGKDVPVYGDGQNIRDWIYVEDHCEALVAVAVKGKIGETYDIGGQSERHNIDIVNKIGEAIRPDYLDLIKFVHDRPGHDLRYAIDISKIKRELNWSPRFSFEDGMANTVAWYLKNQDWWKKLAR